MEFKHVSVLLEETIENLEIKPDGIYVDGTLGGAGHSSGIAERLSAKGHLVGIDQDKDALKAAGERLSGFACRIDTVRSNFEQMEEVLDRLGIGQVDGILLDLGVSSYQLDTAERGFSYWQDARLDMRMDDRNPLSAYDVVNSYSEMELFHLIREYGEESFAKNIAKHIVRYRQEKAVETTGELTEIIKAAIPMKVRKKTGHPAKKTFQAIRIEVNHELQVLSNALEGMIRRLVPGGKLCVITFHSLEDRIVKQVYKKAENPCVCPKDFPVCMCGKKPLGRMVPRKPILPCAKEMEENSRSRSAKLRVFLREGENVFPDE